MTKLIPILSGRCLVVELPEGATKITVESRKHWAQNCIFYETDVLKCLHLPPGNWRIIGMLGEVTDAELADVTGFYYNKYNERYVEMPTSAMRATPAGDVEDAIKAEGYYLDESPIKRTQFTNPDIWDSIQSRVLDRSRCLLLGRDDEN